jgi:hypothetical protein
MFAGMSKVCEGVKVMDGGKLSSKKKGTGVAVTAIGCRSTCGGGGLIIFLTAIYNYVCRICTAQVENITHTYSKHRINNLPWDSMSKIL